MREAVGNMIDSPLPVRSHSFLRCTVTIRALVRTEEEKADTTVH